MTALCLANFAAMFACATSKAPSPAESSPPADPTASELRVAAQPSASNHAPEPAAWPAASASAANPEPAASVAHAPPPIVSGFMVLFDGKNADGWKQAGPGSFSIENGAARSKGGMGLWYYELKSFKDFTLKVEFRQEKVESNSGVFVRFPRVDNDPWIPVREGYEIQISGDKPEKNMTGSIYSFQAPTKIPLKPAGQWNEFEITAKGQNYTVKLNGQLITTYTGNRSTSGMIGLQNHSDGDVVDFRNVRIKEL
jgi:hypothetical protein